LGAGENNLIGPKIYLRPFFLITSHPTSRLLLFTKKAERTKILSFVNDFDLLDKQRTRIKEILFSRVNWILISGQRSSAFRAKTPAV
jgi:hypothetical protein